MLVNKEILFGKYLSGNATPVDLKKLTDWLKQDPSNKAEFDSAEKLWNASLNLKNEKDADVELAWKEFKFLIESQPEIKILKNNTHWMKIAAAITLFIVSGVVVKLFYFQPSAVSPSVISNAVKPSEEPSATRTPDMNPVNLDPLIIQETPARPLAKTSKKFSLPSETTPAMVTVITGDSMEIFMLPDNSIVYLNANSKLEYPQKFNKTNRRVSLIGEAYFDVKKDSTQFIVSCENTIIRGKSTTFNVKSSLSDKQVEVIVASGAVEFSGIGYKDIKKLVLVPGESGYYNKAKSEIIKSRYERKNYKWWQKENLRAKINNFFGRLLGKKN